MTSEGNEPNHENDLYSRLYIDAHLCRPQCGDLGQVNSETGKGIVYFFFGPDKI